jgi:hypothetical protein
LPTDVIPNCGRTGTQAPPRVRRKTKGRTTIAEISMKRHFQSGA